MSLTFSRVCLRLYFKTLSSGCLLFVHNTWACVPAQWLLFVHGRIHTKGQCVWIITVTELRRRSVGPADCRSQGFLFTGFWHLTTAERHHKSTIATIAIYGSRHCGVETVLGSKIGKSIRIHLYLQVPRWPSANTQWRRRIAS